VRVVARKRSGGALLKRARWRWGMDQHRFHAVAREPGGGGGVTAHGESGVA
jgi:hypothetical protein